MIKFHFYYKKNYWLARIIRWTTKGKWNHVSIEIDGVVWEALGLKPGMVVPSHSPSTYHKGKRKAEEIETIRIPVDPETKRILKDHLVASEGKDYDNAGALSFLSPFSKERTQKWFCSELAAWIFGEVADLKFSDKLISPSELYDVIRAYRAGLISRKNG